MESINWRKCSDDICERFQAAKIRLIYNTRFYYQETGPDGAVVMPSANSLVGTGFVSRYRLQPRAGF